MGILLVSLLAGLAMDLSRIVPVIIGTIMGAVSLAIIIILLPSITNTLPLG